MRIPITLERRSFLRGALVGRAGVVAGAQMSGFSAGSARQVAAEPEPGSATPKATGGNVLLAYFSRAGENYYHGDRIDLEVGNTDVLTGIISECIECDVYQIDAAEPYSDNYDETVARNVREQDADTRPAIANPLPSIDGYDMVLLGSPIWNVRAPMIMSTFAESFDFTGKTIFPFTTHAMSGMGNAEHVYQDACRGATFGGGLAVRGEDVIDAPNDAAAAVETWLQGINLLSGVSAS